MALTRETEGRSATLFNTNPTLSCLGLNQGFSK